MGFFKKIFKPVSKVLDKVVPNEIKPALPFLAAFAPFIAPGIMGSSVLQGALRGGGLNILGQLSQEGNEGDINLLSAGLGALSGAMAAPGKTVTSMPGEGAFPPTNVGSGQEFFQGFSDAAQGQTGIMASGQRFVGDTLAKGSELMRAGIAEPFSKAGLKAATLPAATATGDLMFAQAKRDQDEYERKMREESESEADENARRAFAIRRSMEAYGATEDEILDAIYAAGYQKGGRVKYDVGGITQAVGKLENESQDFARQISMDPDVTMDDIVEEFEITFKRKPKDMDELKKFYEDKYDYKGPGDVKMKETIKEKMMVEAKDGGLMDLGGKEMDLRKGGFVPIGKKERADDVPARLSKNEFVMTADAVRAAGGGSVNEGAKRMYKVMNELEARA
jgi:hypothetical protein